MKLIYDVHEKPPFGQNLVYAFQQLLAVIAATILVPILVNGSTGTALLDEGAALLGAGVGTLVYLLFTRFRSPVFLGSSFAFITPLCTAVTFGYWGVILGSVIAGLVYVILAIAIRFSGSGWVDRLMPPVIIGPVVALIGLGLSGSAISNLTNTASSAEDYSLLAILVGIVTFLATILASVKGNRSMKLIPFVIGVLSGYVLAVAITLVGYNLLGLDYCNMVDFSAFSTIGDINMWVPNITFAHAWDFAFTDFLSLFIAFAPVAFVVFAEHIADHKNISSIIEKDLLQDPGLDKTLLGDGIGSMAGALCGGCPNTTYGESVGCVAITGNASVYTICTTAIMCMVLAFFYPFIAFVETIPTCVIGGICIALYGFIAVSGLRMFKHVDLEDPKNLFIVAAILVTGIGGLQLVFTIPNLGDVVISNIACALILGIAVNLILRPKKVQVEKTVTGTPEEREEETMFGPTREDAE